MFEDSVFESAGRIHTRSRRWMVAMFFFNTSILAAMILIPLIHPEALARQFIACRMEAPTVQPEQTEPVKPAAHAAPPPTEMSYGHIFAPSSFSHHIYIATGPEPAPLTGPAGWDPGVAEKTGITFTGSSAPRVVHQERALRVSTAVEAGLLIQKITPIYPPIAKAARVEGTVRLAATISKAGNIENLRVVSGQPMLQQAALDAVKNWLYRPYLLDGQPVEVETTVDVVFTLSR
jgi:protein TonB